VINFDYSRFDQSLTRFLATTRRTLPVVLMEQARGIVRNAIAITPPGKANDGDVTLGGAAKKLGETAIASDIRSIYGTPAQAYDLIKEHMSNTGEPDGFWKHLKRGGIAQANQIFQDATGQKLYPFDDGAVHQRFKKGRARAHARKPVFFLQDTKPLDTYVKSIQKRVGWLASGWNAVAARLGVKPAAWIWRNHGDGSATLRETTTGIVIRAENDVSYAKYIPDMHRRLQSAIDRQAGAMKKRVQSYLKQLGVEHFE
jgi:hypothetical protein